MCLTLTSHHEKDKQELLEKMALGKVKFWKVYLVYNNSLHHMCMTGKVKIGTDGTVKSNRASTKLRRDEVYFGEVDRGIHLFYSYKEARAFKEDMRERIYKVECSPKDLVAVSPPLKEAVFTKIKIIDEKAKKFFPKKVSKCSQKNK